MDSPHIGWKQEADQNIHGYGTEKRPKANTPNSTTKQKQVITWVGSEEKLLKQWKEMPAWLVCSPDDRGGETQGDSHTISDKLFLLRKMTNNFLIVFTNCILVSYY